MSNPNGLPENDFEDPTGLEAVEEAVPKKHSGTQAASRSGPNTVPQGGNDTE